MFSNLERITKSGFLIQTWEKDAARKYILYSTKAPFVQGLCGVCLKRRKVPDPPLWTAMELDGTIQLDGLAGSNRIKISSKRRNHCWRCNENMVVKPRNNLPHRKIVCYNCFSDRNIQAKSQTDLCASKRIQWIPFKVQTDNSSLKWNSEISPQPVYVNWISNRRFTQKY